MELTVRIACFCLLLVSSEQMSFYRKVASGMDRESEDQTWQGYRISESQEAASQPQMVSQKSGDSKRQLHEPGTLRDNIGWEISDHSVLDAELYGADNENMDDVNFDIVLGQRIDLQDSSVGKREKLKGHDVQKRSSKTSPNFHSVKERVKRNAIDKSKDEGKTLSQQTSSVHTTGTHQIKDTNRMDKISRGSQAGILSNASSEESNEIESSGDGEIFPEASKEPKNINSSSASDQNLFRNHTVFDTEDTFSTLTDKEGEAVGIKVVSCNDKNPNSSCLEQSGIGQNSDQDRNQVLSEDGSALDGNVKLNKKNDSSGTEHNVSTTNIGLEDNTSASPSVTSTQQNPDVEVSSQHPAAAVETSAKETTTSVDNQATTNNRGTPEEENQTSYTTITINPVDSDQTTTITTTISDTTKTSMPETTIAQSDSTAATETTKLDATNTPNLFTISDSTATTEKILTDPTIASETTISNSPSAVENTFSDSTTTPEAETFTTAAPKRVPKLGESCDPPSPAVDAGSECVDIPGVGCVNRTCQCKPQWYKAGDACYERELDEGFLLKLDNDQVGSLTVTWPPIKPSANYDLIEYKLRWISVTSTSGDDINTLVSSTKTIEKASSSSKTQIFRSHNLVREKKVLDTGSDTDTDTDANTDTGPVRKKRSSGAKEMVLYTNETTARIQDLTPGEKYEFEVSAMVRMKEDGREEELKYPTGTLRLEPDCLSLETKRLIAGNRTMILTFQDLQGVFNECRVQIGNKKPRLDDCKTFQLHPFEFGTKYKIITEVVAGEQEPKSCRDMSFVYEESKKPGKVSSLSETGVTSDTISVSWDPPSQANGYLTGYDVYLQSEDTCKLYEIRDRSMKGQDEPQEQDKNVGSVHKTNEQSAPVRKECETHDSEILRSAEEQQNLTFTDLELSTEYHVRVFAINKEGMGEESETTINTKSLVPGPPENFTGVATSQSSIALTWIPPEPYPGPTDYYIKVFMRANWEIDTDLTKNPIYNDTVTGYETRRKTIHDLRLATAYDFKIEAKTSAGKSIEVTTGPVQTWEKRSPAVDGLEDSTVTFDTVALVWRQPPQGNGRTRAYVILVKDTGDTCLQAFALVNSKSNLGPFQPSVSSLDKLLSMTCPSGQILKETVPDDKRLATSATIKALKPNTLYTFEVIPYNGAGLGDSSSLQRRTKNAIPNEPTGFACATHEPGELRLSWTPPVPMPGITSYELRVVAQNGLPHMGDQHFNDFKTLTIKGYSEETYILKGLNPYWKFKVYMKASTPAGKSTEVSTDICTTLPAGQFVIHS
ncbi:phosphatidylinositol phosphatase ptprq [Plakobranchus ocellatus]|uniref:Phosphatidylinositol phosphatase ptprq n=1 Tax=Plakobranchus ocellatus TaxID=259542 RepID=A0AAV3Z5T2_9GAST|nr:phosphatidylinositol phosphatase ptprq [Plakobranchus ocellatus]